MIRLTRAGEYAVRAVLYLAGQPAGQVIDREKVATAQEIPPSFLSKILQRLTTAGIIRSYKGASGGFTLARSADKISMLDVLKAIEGPLALNTCLIEVGECDRSATCPVHPIWQSVQDKIETTLSEVSFARLAKAGPNPGQVLDKPTD